MVSTSGVALTPGSCSSDIQHREARHRTLEILSIHRLRSLVNLALRDVVAAVLGGCGDQSGECEDRRWVPLPWRGDLSTRAGER
jgi:hypothetical protein